MSDPGGAQRSCPRSKRRVFAGASALDDRGSRVDIHASVFGEQDLEVSPKRHESNVQSECSSVKGMADLAISSIAIVLTVLGLLSVAYILASLPGSAIGRMLGVSSSIGTILFVGLIAATILLARLAGLRIGGRSVAAELLKGPLSGGICACCRYDMSEVKVEDDGISRCPECGSSWNLPEWKRSYVVGNSNRAKSPSESPETADPKHFVVALTDVFGTKKFVRSPTGNEEPSPIFVRWVKRPHRRQWPIPLGFAILAGLSASFAGSTMHERIRLALFAAALSGATSYLIVLMIKPGGRALHREAMRLASSRLKRGVCPACASQLSDAPLHRFDGRRCDQCMTFWSSDPAAISDKHAAARALDRFINGTI